MNKIFLLFFFLAPISNYAKSSEEPSELWIEDEEVMKCVPNRMQLGASLKLELGKEHGKELSIYRQSENLTLFLVVGSAPDEMKSLMKPADFKKTKSVNIDSSTTGFKWDAKGGNEVIFNSEGAYTIYASNNLESEEGGYRCEVLVVGK